MTWAKSGGGTTECNKPLCNVLHSLITLCISGSVLRFNTLIQPCVYMYLSSVTSTMLDRSIIWPFAREFYNSALYPLCERMRCKMSFYNKHYHFACVFITLKHIFPRTVNSCLHNDQHQIRVNCVRPFFIRKCKSYTTRMCICRHSSYAYHMRACCTCTAFSYANTFQNQFMM